MKSQGWGPSPIRLVSFWEEILIAGLLSHPSEDSAKRRPGAPGRVILSGDSPADTSLRLLLFEPQTVASCYSSPRCLRYTVTQLVHCHLIPYTPLYTILLFSMFLWKQKHRMTYTLKKFFNIYFYLFAMPGLVVACGIFSCSMWDLISWAGMESKPSALGAWSLSHWTASEVPRMTYI